LRSNVFRSSSGATGSNVSFRASGTITFFEAVVVLGRPVLYRDRNSLIRGYIRYFFCKDPSCLIRGYCWVGGGIK
jgi:hypothetical protein